MKIASILASGVCVLLLVGCATASVSNTPRTATEQLLISQSVDKAMQQFSTAQFAGQNVFIDATYFNSVDKEYVIDSIRNIFNQAGAKLVDPSKPNLPAPDVVVEVRSGALGTDMTSFLIGLPAIPIVVPGAGTITTPEIAIFKIERQTGTGKIRLFAYNPTTREEISTQGAFGSAYVHTWTILLCSFTTSDIPERYWRHPRTEAVEAK